MVKAAVAADERESGGDTGVLNDSSNMLRLIMRKRVLCSSLSR